MNAWAVVVVERRIVANDSLMFVCVLLLWLEPQFHGDAGVPI